MRIVISGYGRMGKEVEKAALSRNHHVVATVDNEAEFTTRLEAIKTADVAIDFSTPNVAADNILRFFDVNIPMVVGTTGWFDKFADIQRHCIEQEQTLFWATNMSIGVNILFSVNKFLAKIMDQYPEYKPLIEEKHHNTKLDIPSGTAITLAEGIMEENNHLDSWKVVESAVEENCLPIHSIREGTIVGEHTIQYTAPIDQITLQHKAFTREGFATGSLIAAEWIQGKKGIYTMKDLLNL